MSLCSCTTYKFTAFMNIKILNHLIWIPKLDCGSKLHNCKFFRLINIKRQISKENTDEFTNRTKISFRVLCYIRAYTPTHHIC